MSRRRFLAATAAGAAAASIGAVCDPALIRRAQQAKTMGAPHHTVWVWQFSTDSNPDQIAANAAENGLGVLVKTHDGVDWMSRYDTSTNAVSGPAQVERLARVFERNGVPFHTWSVIKGIDPQREAQMVADVLDAGARSLVLDLEGSAGFWVGSRDDAARFGDALRTLSPYGRVDISIDPRPWRINLVPMAEFVAATDGIWPQLYWETFSSTGNLDGYRNSGYPPGPNGITPEFLLDVTWKLLQGYDRDVIPVGQGATRDTSTWARFVKRAWELGMGSTSAWRYGVTPYEVLVYLGDNPAGVAPKPPRTPTPAADATETPRPTRTPRPTKTATPTRTRTSTPTRTPVPADTATPSITPAASATATPTV